MHAPKGFGKRYFTLSAIQAYSGGATLMRTQRSICSHHEAVLECHDRESETESDDPPPPPGHIPALPSGGHRSCHCNLFFYRRTCRRLNLHYRPKRMRRHHRHLYSTLSPPAIPSLLPIKYTIKERK